ncbi:DUF5658 family protein [Desulforamulus aquiferis]|uniref:DUF5658 family protein n=1 Tax=Desulforamulus aquiferis TaxID=1397668 RepID=A0AAW7ZH98_9FIRM|nr:DUF5658 family protein [Desulforamulus aquiferis]MDO7788638.1 DUF5658 family protein [Desulforamulus aquiferis]
MFLLPAIVLLTLADLLLTYHGLKLGLIQEFNPLMAWLYQINPKVSVAIVFSLVALGCLFLYLVQGQVSWLPTALAALLVIKLGVLGLHLGWLVQTLALGSYLNSWSIIF